MVSTPRNPYNYMDYYSFTDPEGWKAELVSFTDTYRTLYP